MFIVHYLSISVPFFFLVWGGGGESWIMLIRKIEYFGFEASAYGIKDWKQIIWFFSLNYYRTSFVYRIRLWWPFIYIYIYIHPFTKTLLFPNIYHIYVKIPKKDLSNVDTHYISPVVWPLLTIFVFDKKYWRYRRKKGIIIYMIYKFWISNVFENGCIYNYIFIYIACS